MAHTLNWAARIDRTTPFRNGRPSRGGRAIHAGRALPRAGIMDSRGQFVHGNRTSIPGLQTVRAIIGVFQNPSTFRYADFRILQLCTRIGRRNGIHLHQAATPGPVALRSGDGRHARRLTGDYGLDHIRRNAIPSRCGCYVSRIRARIARLAGSGTVADGSSRGQTRFRRFHLFTRRRTGISGRSRLRRT